MQVSGKAKGGGVAVLIRNDYPACSVQISDKYSICEVCAVDLIGKQGITCRLICVYRPQWYSLENNRLLFELLANLTSNCVCALICGDFNFPGIDWKAPSHYDSFSLELFHFLVSEGLTQLVDEPTHILGNTLDLLIASDEFLIHSWFLAEGLLSDHLSLYFCLNISGPDALVMSPRYDYSNCRNMKIFLSHINWDLIFDNCITVEDYWAEFKGVLDFAMKNFLSQLTSCRQRSFQISAESKKAIFEKKTDLEAP